MPTGRNDASDTKSPPIIQPYDPHTKRGPPQRLEDTNDAKINNAALEEFASLQLSFKFTGYVMHKGKLTLMSAVESPKSKKK